MDAIDNRDKDREEIIEFMLSLGLDKGCSETKIILKILDEIGMKAFEAGRTYGYGQCEEDNGIGEDYDTEW